MYEELKEVNASSVTVGFFYSREWNSESPVQWQGLVYIWQAGIGTPTQSHVVSNHNDISERL